MAPGESVGASASRASGALAVPELDVIDERVLVELMCSAARLTACAEAVGLAAVAELARRREQEAAVDPLSVPVEAEERGRFVAAEVAVALRLSPGAARARIELAQDLRTRLPATRAALGQGRISLAHARRLSEAVAPLSDDVAARVEAEVIDRATGQTPAQLGASLRRAVLRANPDGGRAARERAAARRSVRIYPVEDGLAVMSITARADLVMAAYERISAVAAERVEDERRRRACAAHAASNAVRGDHTGAAFYSDDVEPGVPVGPGPGAQREPGPLGLEQTRADVALELLAGDAETLAAVDTVHVTLGVIAPVGAVLGADDEPGELQDYGPIPAEILRELATDAAWQRWWTASPEPAGEASHPAEHNAPPGTPDTTTDTRDAANPHSTAPDTAAPRVGTVVGVGRRRYRPTAALADAIRARDGECRFPTCRRRATACDLDHITPFAHGGPTTAENLLTLCRHHHRLKHRSNWQVSLDADGTATWTTPTGHQHTSDPRRWPTSTPDHAHDLAAMTPRKAEVAPLTS